MTSDRSPAPAVALTELHKRFARPASWDQLLRGRLRGPAVAALCGASLSIDAGEIVVLLGENGAGKSTLLRCIAGLIAPDRGQVQVHDRNVLTAGAELRRQVSYVTGDHRAFSWRLSGRDNLRFFAALYGLSGRAASNRVEAALARAGLASHAADRPVREYSTGMRQRLSLARGFLASPSVWLFDEPTAGLDPRASRELLRFIGDQLVGSHGCAALVATHSMDHARDLTSRAVVLAGGRVAFDGAIDRAVEHMVGTAP
jgi:ABC-2 type transport system ATP-binding protein